MPDYKCIHEELLQEHNKKIEALDVKSQYKESRIDELYAKIEKMEDKIDNINENVNKIVQSSIESDNKLEQRLTKLETTVKVLKWVTGVLFGSGIIWVVYSFIH